MPSLSVDTGDRLMEYVPPVPPHEAPAAAVGWMIARLRQTDWRHGEEAMASLNATRVHFIKTELVIMSRSST